MPTEVFIGIDYGTSACKLSYATAPLGGKDKTPTLANLPFSTSSGMETSFRYPSSVLFVAKRANKLGLKFGYDAMQFIENQKELNKYHHYIVKSPKLEIGKGLFYPFAPQEASEPSDLVYLTLNNILKEFEQIGIKRKNAKILITVPSSFGVQHRKEMLEALERLKIEIDESNLIDEPNAALLGLITDPLFSTTIRRANENKVLIIDYGAGTCDISLLKIKEDFSNEPYGISIENMAINDYAEFGGNIIDTKLAELIIPQILDKEQASLFESDDFKKLIAYEKLIEELTTEKTKKQKEHIILDLIKSQQDQKTQSRKEFTFRIESIKFYLNQLKEQFSFLRNNKIRIHKEEFSNIISSLIYDHTVLSITGLIENVLSKANVNYDEVGSVVFVGGSSRIFQIKQFQEELLSKVFRKLKTEHLIFPKDPDLLISKGAAIECYNRYYSHKSLLRPICPSTIGIKTAEGEFLPLIEAGRGLPIPNTEDRLNTLTLYAPNIAHKNNSMKVPLYIERFGRLIPFEIWTVSLPDEIAPNEKLLFDAKMNLDKTLTVIFRSYKNPTKLFHKACDNYLSSEELTTREIKINDLRIKIRDQKKQNNIVNANDLYDLVLLERNIYKYRSIAKQRCMQFLELGCFGEGDNANLYNVLGLIANMENKYGEALRYYKKAVELRPANSILNYNVGVTYLWNTTEYEMAEKYLQNSINYYGQSYDAHFYLGTAKSKNSKEIEAKEEYRKALEIIKGFFANNPSREMINKYAAICDHLDLEYPKELKDKLLNPPPEEEEYLEKIQALGDNKNIIRARPELNTIMEAEDEEEY